MIRHLAEQGASINEQDGSGFTALMLAVSANSAAATEELLENDANVNIKTWSGMTVRGAYLVGSSFLSFGRSLL